MDIKSLGERKIHHYDTVVTFSSSFHLRLHKNVAIADGILMRRGQTKAGASM